MMKDFICFNDGSIHNNILSKYTGNDKNVVIPDCFEMLEFDSFKNNKNIESVEIPESVKIIKSGAFEGCVNIKSVIIPGGLYGIAPNTFGDAETTANFLLTNPNYENRNGFIINKTNNVLLFVLDDSEDTYSIPEGLIMVGPYAFSYCTELKEIAIPEGIEHIGMASFFFCNNLKKISFPKTLKSIGAAAFSGCWNLKGAAISEGVDIDVSNAGIFETDDSEGE